MSTADTTTEAFASTRPSSADALRYYAPIPRLALGPALNKQGYYEMFEVIRSETPADLVELNARLLAKTGKAFDGIRPI
jgi:hypothetical protein